MLINRFVLFILLFSFSAYVAQAEEKTIYKKYNKDGVVEFSDLPDKKSKAVRVPPMNTYKQKPFPKKFQEKVEEKTTVTRYDLINITAPVNDTQVRENSGNVSVSIKLTPTLNPAHSVKLVLDGNEEAAVTGNSLTLTLKNVSRGTHKLQAFIIDKDGNVLIQSNSIVFHLKRYSSANKPAPKAKKAKP